MDLFKQYAYIQENAWIKNACVWPWWETSACPRSSSFRDLCCSAWLDPVRCHVDSLITANLASSIQVYGRMIPVEQFQWSCWSNASIVDKLVEFPSHYVAETTCTEMQVHCPSYQQARNTLEVHAQQRESHLEYWGRPGDGKAPRTKASKV